MNISISELSETGKMAQLFQLIGQPIRIQILLAIGDSEACVCHLEAVTGLRQAVISQHLMLLRKAGLVTPNRSGRNIFYRLAKPETVPMIQAAAEMLAIPVDMLARFTAGKIPGCPCPKCEEYCENHS
ncbi:MAG: metalloregulator ArsR/SmtB family transcription factor [Anaerolineaceae bacterium]